MNIFIISHRTVRQSDTISKTDKRSNCCVFLYSTQMSRCHNCVIVERVTGEVYRVVFIKDLFGSILIGRGEGAGVEKVQYSSLFAASCGIKNTV